MKNKISRRKLLKTAALTMGTLAVPAIWSPSQAQGKKRITIRDDGGIYNLAYSAVFYRPFTEKTGIEVISVPANAEPAAQIRSMVEAGSYTWDMAKISQPTILMLTSGDKKYLQKHNLESNPTIATIPQKYMSEWGVGNNIYATVLAYRNEAFKGKTVPSAWKDFFDKDKFEGRRALRRHPFDTIEEALFADGVASADIYPCDIDRAFKKLDQIKRDIDVFWTSGAQVEQMLQSGEVDMVPTWVSRAHSAIAAGTDIGVVWDQNIWGVDNWAILEGTPNADLCREFIIFASDAERNAGLMKFFPAGIAQVDAFNFIKPEIAKNSPSFPANSEKGLQINAAYWRDNQAKVIEQYNQWLLG
ncbi:ABC transporter substrate-binding protein [Bartonella sp. M0176]|nr:ABC transporter substrate-binding protein [Bartonella sp. P0291]MBH9997262.1 ABC transporter substrate-binding protein [Bartonella sp. M0192]MBH9999422.1 ABC transporter substrate-binding protein [Bartonella sp. M0191]MBI0007096.1 ABC transporter substrate-binding protein [Bartonella sp. M0193]MBI0010713.1 ABC transporter substrate-binding protein [Bartonella sp. M0176]MBI0012166.1 ABC transporter substrate-binding protein [Bartonella apihabitans]